MMMRMSYELSDLILRGEEFGIGVGVSFTLKNGGFGLLLHRDFA